VSGVPDQRLRSRCLGIIACLPVPEPFDLEQFRVNLEGHRGRPLLLLPAETGTECSGMWVGTEDADYIFYAQDTTPVHQRHIVVHEIGHMAFDHQGSRLGGDELARLLFPNLNPALVQSFLARSVYSDDEECEAETFASVLLGRVKAQQGVPGLRPGEAELLQRIAGAFSPAQPGYGK
jgi:hypothetical protein